MSHGWRHRSIGAGGWCRTPAAASRLVMVWALQLPSSPHIQAWTLDRPLVQQSRPGGCDGCRRGMPAENRRSRHQRNKHIKVNTQKTPPISTTSLELNSELWVLEKCVRSSITKVVTKVQDSSITLNPKAASFSVNPESKLAGLWARKGESTLDIQSDIQIRSLSVHYHFYCHGEIPRILKTIPSTQNARFGKAAFNKTHPDNIFKPDNTVVCLFWGFIFSNNRYFRAEASKTKKGYLASVWN